MLSLSRLSLLALLPTTFALGPITVKGSRLFNPDGSQFYIKGVAYQLTDSDPLADPQQCQLDAALMKTLGANTIRVYHVDASADHDSCMSTFADAGIYTLIDLDTYDTFLYNTPSPPTWTTRQYNAFQAVMDAFQGYDNVLGFFVANELLTMGIDSRAAPYFKAAARDMKAYRDAKGYRQFPIGYSAADVAVLRPNLQNYFACGGNASESMDFYSLNTYEWCGDQTYQGSGYAALQQNASGYPIPIFFSEDGCIVPSPRTFQDQTAILGPEMTNTWSGAIIYEWIQFINGYGLISYGPPVDPTVTGPNINQGFTIAGTPTPIAPDFNNLASQWATLNPTGTSYSDFTPDGTTPACPAYTASVWEVNGNVPLPTLNEVFSQFSQVAQTQTLTSAPASKTTAGSLRKTTQMLSSGSVSGSGSTSPSSSATPSSDTSDKSSASARTVVGFGLGGVSLAATVVLTIFGFAILL